MVSILSRRSFLAASAGGIVLRAEAPSAVRILKAPFGALQPQAVVDAYGVIHLVYLYGNPSAADIAYVRKAPEDAEFSPPIRVNSHPGSAVALGTVRGAHLALGRSDHLHVAWNGSAVAEPQGRLNSAPMLYTRWNDTHHGFERQRSVMQITSGLDGGGTLAADRRGNVFVAWHAQSQENGKLLAGEGHRRVWLAYSSDDGNTFAAETQVSPEGIGACGCCGMGALADGSGEVYLFFRSARNSVHRDMYLLVSSDTGKTFRAVHVHPWNVGACPMSTVALASAGRRILVAWETGKQVYYAPVYARRPTAALPIPAPGAGSNRKHPAIAVAPSGHVLLVWTEGTGWKTGGSLAWQCFDESGRPVGKRGQAPGLNAWNFAAAVWVNGGFSIIS